MLDWLTTYTFPLESSFGNVKSPMYQNCVEPPDPLQRAKTVYNRVVSQTLAHGTTLASYYATIHVEATNALADICLKKGQRALVGRVCMDDPRQCPDYYCDSGTEDSICKTEACVEYCRKIDPQGILVQPIITPRFAPSCQKHTLEELGKLSQREGVKIQTHVSENLNEIKLVKEMFPDHGTYAEVYDACGLLTDRTILAHAVHLDRQEIALIRQRKAKISHCPASNSALGSGFCPVRELLDEGIEVGLGTDVSGGFSVSVLEALRQACLVSRHVGHLKGGDSRYNISVAEGLYLATAGGAKVVGMEGRMGGFEVGMFWDAQEIQLAEVSRESEAAGNVDVFGWESWDEKVAKWAWNGDDRHVRRVWVGGRLVHQRS